VTHWSEGLFDKPILRVVKGYDDPHLSYEFDITDLVQTADGWYVVSTTGCSCPSYEERAWIDCGPLDINALASVYWREYGSNDSVSSYYNEKNEAMKVAFAEAAHD